jgi:hypothetical protein
MKSTGCDYDYMLFSEGVQEYGNSKEAILQVNGGRVTKVNLAACYSWYYSLKDEINGNSKW